MSLALVTGTGVSLYLHGLLVVFLFRSVGVQLIRELRVDSKDLEVVDDVLVNIVRRRMLGPLVSVPANSKTEL